MKVSPKKLKTAYVCRGKGHSWNTQQQKNTNSFFRNICQYVKNVLYISSQLLLNQWLYVIFPHGTMSYQILLNKDLEKDFMGTAWVFRSYAWESKQTKYNNNGSATDVSFKLLYFIMIETIPDS